MKKIFAAILSFVLCVSVLSVGRHQAYAESSAGTESIWFPAPTMNLVQLAYEGYSHGEQNAIDILPGGDVFAPVSGKIVYTDPNWGYVVLQSNEKVYWADGTYDYATIGFMHDSDIGNLYVGMELSQGEAFYQAGGMGDGNPNAYGAHVHLTVHRGHVTRGYPYGTGDEYAFNAFLINPEYTTEFSGRGEGYAVSGMKDGAPDNYTDLWKTYEPGYLSQCQLFPTHGKVKVLNAVNIKLLPCSYETNIDSTVVRKAKVDEWLEVTGLYKNTAGNYWYRVNSEKGVGFLYAGDVSSLDISFDDIQIRGVSAPQQLNQGSYFSITGEISSEHTKIDSVCASVTDNSGKVLFSSTDKVGRNYYSLLNSKLDMDMLFNALGSGSYTYKVWVDVTANISDDGKTKSESRASYTLVSEQFYVS